MMNYLSIRVGSVFLIGLYLAAVHADLNDPELYVADYYPQDPYRYRYHDQFQDNYLQPSFADESGYFLDYPTEPHSDNSNQLDKRVLSSFRERMEREKSKERQEKFAEYLLERLQDIENKQLEKEYDENRNYVEMIENLWGKYKDSQYDRDSPIFVGDVKKRQIPFPVDYSTLGWSGAGYKKRLLPDLNRQTHSDYLYAKRKRFPVAKRSSNFHKKPISKKLATAASGTDPKIVQDLSKIFENKQNITLSSTNKTLDQRTSENKKVTNREKPSVIVLPSAKSITHNHNDLNNELFNEPLNIKKKSIDWSNYFGIDRRKKNLSSPNNDIDNEWLIKRYNQVVATAVKRNSQYPLKIFRNHDIKKESELPETDKVESKSESTKLHDMDDKLKNMEDLIIDEALKYTGAHEGETDIQEIKDKVISKLAAAYSLEKMRRALEEFKSSLLSEKYENERNMPSSNSNPSQAESMSEINEKDKKSFEEEKKCDSKTGQCENMEMSNEIQSALGRCETVESRCHRAMTTGSGYNSMFYLLCKWYHLCYLCMKDNLSENEDLDDNNIDELGMCESLFMQRADMLCRGDVICTWSARPALAAIRQMKPISRNCNREQYCAR